MKNQSHENKRSPRKRIVNFLVHVLLAVLALIWVMPIVWIVLTSFRAEPGALRVVFRDLVGRHVRDLFRRELGHLLLFFRLGGGAGRGGEEGNRACGNDQEREF